MGLLDAPPSTRVPQVRPIVSAMRRNRTSVSLGVLSDSTGVPQDFTTDQRWPYLLSAWLGAQFPAYTVIFKQWNDTSQTYDADRTVQTGSGSNTLTVYNCAVTGVGYNYVYTGTMTRINLVFPTAPTEIVVSYGYNSTVTVAGAYRAPYFALTSFLRRVYPTSALSCVGQAPTATSYASAADHLLRQADIRALAMAEGYGFIDVTQRFIDLGSYDSLFNGDFLHPTAAGSQVWLAEMQQFFGVKSSKALPAATPTLRIHKAIPAKLFDLYSGSPTYGLTNNQPSWTMPASADAAIIASCVDLPADWPAVNVYLIWFTAATSGTASFTPRYGSLSTLYGNQSGGNTALLAQGVYTAAVSATANTMKFTPCSTALRITQGTPLFITVTHNGSTDGVASAIQIVGLLFERAG